MMTRVLRGRGLGRNAKSSKKPTKWVGMIRRREDATARQAKEYPNPNA
jgi:hypothetical protein